MPPSSPQDAPADAATNPDQPKPRRFAPEPIETTTKSSKSARRHSPEKQDAPKARRFALEPIETTTESSRKNPESTQDNKSKPRRFAPEPIETTHKSSKGRSDEKSSSSHIRFKPQLVETQYGGNRKPSRQTSMESDASTVASTVASEDATPRKFTPVVLSTAKRSRRVGDSNAVNYQDYKTEEGHTIHAREHQKHAGWKTPDYKESKTEANDHAHNVSDSSHELIPPDMKRPVSPLDGSAPPRPAALNATRSHSFRLPDLDTIESSESERESGPSSMSCSPGQGSPITASDSSFNEFYKHATRIRESVDENFSNYFLQLEARKAEQRLQEQALAAFPNSDFHEPVQHYVNDDQDSLDDEIEDRPVTWEGFDEEEYLVKIRRESTKVPWEQLEMQRHAEKMEQERNANKVTAKKESHSPWWNPDAAPSIHQPDNEMRSMRDRARPPMLGRDLVFPRCPSPEPARFDVTQGSDKLRQQMCYLNEQSQSAQTHDDEGGLWNAAPKNAVQSTASSNSIPSKGAAGKGLWGGSCIGEEQQSTNNGLMPPSGPTGLMTPAPRTDSTNPFEQSFAAGGAVVHSSLAAITTPPSPPASLKGADIAHLDAVLVSERDFDEMFSREYPDDFVTQVFNYLSLGYPSLARPFDDELSKISRIPVPELRQDDVKAKQSPRGYIRLGQDFEGGGGEGISEDSCVRWQALKLYIREWARQEKNMVRVDAPGGNWATTNRRGSWAI